MVVADINPESLDRFETETGIPGVQVNVSDFNDVERMRAEVEARFGMADVLVNNAGITRDGFMHKMDPASQWQAVIDVNLTGVFNMCRAFAPGMRERGFGRIINISSMNGQRGQFGQANYVAAKAGVLGFTRPIAQELAGKGVTANAVCPGFILTEMTASMSKEILESEVAKIPVGRIGSPDDIANTVSFLASEQAGFITGATLSVNGGQYMAA
ncbi:SDR family oxidoreductase [Aestuariirhabdus sp. LZHN29]|uniref:SDR family oxidoreductase n=1 Tax=Aestuariirhabdus sp. LZHN29 TaxID=3417462 RepID=UPI003CE7E260